MKKVYGAICIISFILAYGLVGGVERGCAEINMIWCVPFMAVCIISFILAKKG